MDALPTSLADTATTIPVSSQLATFAATLRAEEIPSDVMEQAKRHMLDCLGIGWPHFPTKGASCPRNMKDLAATVQLACCARHQPRFLHAVDQA